MESALDQIYPNIEFLIVDDGSTDSSLSIIQGIKQGHLRGKDIRILINENNLGVAVARNRIIDEARGEYLFFMDADDVIKDNTIALLLEQICKHNAEIVFGSYEKIETVDGERMISVFHYPDRQFHGQDEFATYVYRKYGGIQASSCNFLVKTALLREKHLHFYPVNFWEDMVFVLDLATYVTRAVTLSTVTYYYLRRPHSLSHHELSDRDEVFRNFGAIEYLKIGTAKLKGKPYYSGRCYIAVMTDFYIICNLLKHRHRITPPVSNSELMTYMNHPASLDEILCFRQLRLDNLALWILGKLPASLGLAIVKILGRRKNLI
jgi:glycosyltransferase involved in cell wall biosynthesis